MKNDHKKQYGFTMIEVLITVMVLSIGLLGLAALQTVGMRNTSHAYYRSQATVLGNAFIERMRANSTGVDNGDYRNVNSAAVICNAPPNPYCARNGGTAAQACDVDQLATFDIYTVSCGLVSGANELGGIDDVLPNPGSSLTVNCIDADPGDGIPCTVGSNHTLTLVWNEIEDSAAVGKTLTMTFTP
jgi:type IV pilus assembly protein PilV